MSNVTPIRAFTTPDRESTPPDIRLERARHVLDLYVRSIEPLCIPALELLRTELAEIEAEIEK